jgi:hypothetical protein
MRKSTTSTTFILELSVLLDKGITYPIDVVNKHIENKDVIDWLEKEFPFGTPNGIDFSMFAQKHRDYLHDGLESIWGAYVGSERRKWGISNNGLCLLLSWTIEMVRDVINKDDFL